MRKKLTLTVFLLILAFASEAQAYHFQAVAPSGQTLYYKIEDKTKHQVEVVSPHSYSTAGNTRRHWDGFTKPAGRVEVPAYVTYNGETYEVIGIGSNAFYNCEELTSLILPKTVVKLDVVAFEYCCNLAEIRVLPGNPVFDSRDNCNAVINTKNNELVRGCKNTVIPNSVTSIDWYAFRGSGLTSITIPESVRYISNQAFYGCPLTAVTIPTTVKELGYDAFMSDNVTVSLTTTPLKLKANQYYFEDVYDDDGFAQSICVVPCGMKKTYENSGWTKYYEFWEDCEPHDITINDAASAGLRASVSKAKFGEKIQLTYNPSDCDIEILWGDSKTTISVENSSFVMPHHDVTVKAVRKQNTTSSHNKGVEALGGKTLQQLLSKMVTNVTYRFPEGGVHIGESNKEGICIQVQANGNLLCGDYYTDEQTFCYRMYIIDDPDQYEIPNCPGGWAYVGTSLDNKKDGDKGLIFDRNGKIIYFGAFRNDKPVEKYPMNFDFSATAAYTLQAIEYSNGDVYLGQLIDGVPNGMGLYIWASGGVWFGGWENNKMNSRGIYKNYDGSFFTGVWKNDEQVK